MKVKYSKELLEPIIKDSYSIAEVCRKLGLKPVGGNYTTIKDKISLYNLDTSHFTGQGWSRGLSNTERTARYSLEEVCKENINYSSSDLKKRLIIAGIKNNVCEVCGISGEEVCLELHHINGNHYDNRLENLQILCPNCHSKTPNFRNRNTSQNVSRINKQYNHSAICEYCGKEFYSPRTDKIQRFCCRECYHNYIKQHISNSTVNTSLVNKEILTSLCEKYSTITQIAEELNISRPTVKKYLQQYDLYDSFKLKYDFHTKAVLQYDSNYNLIKEWPSVTDAEETLHIYKVSECASGKRRSAGGYFWRYKE